MKEGGEGDDSSKDQKSIPERIQSGLDAMEKEDDPRPSVRDPNGPNPYLIGGPKPVFVTELNHRDDEAYVVPVVKESGDKLIESGINSMQRTILVKKEVELDDIDVELARKRVEFHNRMEECQRRRQVLAVKQQKMKDQFSKMEKFVTDNEHKRLRALTKYNDEQRQKTLRSHELEGLVVTLFDLQQRRNQLRDKLVRYRCYAEFMDRVVALLPDNYLESSDNMVKALMMRHNTLSDTNKTLRENLDDITDEFEASKKELVELKTSYDNKIMDSNSTLKRLQLRLENRREQVKRLEERKVVGVITKQDKIIDAGLVKSSIGNVSSFCKLKYATGKFEPSPKATAYQNELDEFSHNLKNIEDFYLKQDDVLAEVRAQEAISKSAGSARTLAGSVARK